MILIQGVWKVTKSLSIEKIKVILYGFISGLF